MGWQGHDNEGDVVGIETMSKTTPQEVEANLLPCPFCGEAGQLAELCDDGDIFWIAECSKCPVKTYDQATADDAAIIWNTRFDAGVQFARGQWTPLNEISDVPIEAEYWATDRHSDRVYRVRFYVDDDAAKQEILTFYKAYRLVETEPAPYQQPENRCQ